MVQVTGTRPKITVTSDWTGVVSHAGSRLLADLADRGTLTAELSQALGPPRAVHDPGRDADRPQSLPPASSRSTRPG